MTPLSLSIQNFGPFRKLVLFEFPKEPGLYFLWGENQDEPRLGANGAGKSKLWEALVWCWFGKTSRGLKAGDAANWEAGKGTVVTFSFDRGRGPEQIRRTWGPISWTYTYEDRIYDLAKDSNHALAALRLDLVSFLNCILMPQGEPLFLDLKAEAKAALFAKVMDLDRWVEYSKRSSEMASDAWSIFTRFNSKLKGVEAHLEQMDGEPLEKLHDEWLHQREKKFETIELAYAGLLNKEEKAKARMVDAQGAEEMARARLRACLTLEEKAAEAFDEARDDAQEIARKYAVLESRALAAMNQLNAVADRKHCPTCNQDVAPEVRRKAISQAQSALDALEEEQSALAVVERAHKDALTACQDRLQGARKDVRVSREVVEEASAQAHTIRIEKEGISRRLDDLQREEESLLAEVGPYQALIDQRDEQMAELRRDRDRLRARVDEANEGALRCEGWMKWFKEIRLELISAALNELEIEVNSCVNAKGLSGWEVKFEVDRETQSGSIQRGFNVTIQSPHNSKPVPWESWSGGESQRLRVATQEGLANLIRSRTGATLNLEVWDEPTQWMSGQGVADLLDSLAERARVESRQIWIVDHRSLGYGNFTGSSGVIKSKEGGSTFDQSGLYR